MSQKTLENAKQPVAPGCFEVHTLDALCQKYTPAAELCQGSRCCRALSPSAPSTEGIVTSRLADGHWPEEGQPQDHTNLRHRPGGNTTGFEGLIRSLIGCAVRKAHSARTSQVQSATPLGVDVWLSALSRGGLRLGAGPDGKTTSPASISPQMAGSCSLPYRR